MNGRCIYLFILIFAFTLEGRAEEKKIHKFHFKKKASSTVSQPTIVEEASPLNPLVTPKLSHEMISHASVPIFEEKPVSIGRFEFSLGSSMSGASFEDSSAIHLALRVYRDWSVFSQAISSVSYRQKYSYDVWDRYDWAVGRPIQRRSVVSAHGPCCRQQEYYKPRT